MTKREVKEMTPYKELLGLAETKLTDQQILNALEDARKRNKWTVEFTSGKGKVSVTTFPVNSVGIIRDDWYTT
jgi:hypothetical protein